MRTTTEFEIKVHKGRIIYPQNVPDGTYKMIMEIATPITNCTTIDSAKLCREFIRVPASELSVKDKWFLNHQPNTVEEEKFYKRAQKVIEMGVKDFYRPKYDPSFNDEENGICYVSGKEPATGKNYEWWVDAAITFNPKCQSRLGTKTEYIAFFAVIIKSLVASGWTVANAWNAVCNDSKDLGHYLNSRDAKYEFENTGSREVLGFCDLGNTYKILAEDKEFGGFWIASGGYNNYGSSYPLADLCHTKVQLEDNNNGTGWLVLEST